MAVSTTSIEQEFALKRGNAFVGFSEKTLKLRMNVEFPGFALFVIMAGPLFGKACPCFAVFLFSLGNNFPKMTDGLGFSFTEIR